MTRLVTIPVGASRVHVLAVVHGLLSEADAVEDAFRAAAPDAVALGVAPAELEGLDAHAQGSAEETDEEETLDPAEAYALGLSRYGDIGLPPPDLLAAVALARERGVEPVAVDLDGSQYDEVFAANVGPFALFRYGRLLRKMGKRPPEAPDAVAFARAWDARIRRLRGFGAVEKARERQIASRVEDLASRHRAVLLVVDVARADGVVAALRGEGT